MHRFVNCFGYLECSPAQTDLKYLPGRAESTDPSHRNLAKLIHIWSSFYLSAAAWSSASEATSSGFRSTWETAKLGLNTPSCFSVMTLTCECWKGDYLISTPGDAPITREAIWFPSVILDISDILELSSMKSSESTSEPRLPPSCFILPP